MSSLDNSQKEAKIQFLNFIMAADFEAGALIYNKELDRGLNKLHFIATKIYFMIANEADIKPLYESLEDWREHFERLTQKELVDAYARLSFILSKYFYAELQLGIIPTGSLPTSSDRPSSEALDPNQSSRLS